MFATYRATSRKFDINRLFDGWLDRCALMSVKREDEEREKRTIATEEAADVTAARNGDEYAFQRIVQRYQSTLADQMRRFSRDRNVVEDLVHDAFVEAFLSLPSFRGKSPIEHWLRKIAVRMGYRYWKRNAREEKQQERARHAFVSAPKCFEDPTNAIDAHEQLHAMLSKLAPRDRLVLTLLYWNDCSIAEAAELAGWTKAMVKVQAHRARKRLKKLLEENQ